MRARFDKASWRSKSFDDGVGAGTGAANGRRGTCGAAVEWIGSALITGALIF